MYIIELLLLAAIWGASFLFMRIGTPEFGPVPLIALRVGIAALVMLPVLRSATARAHLRAKAWPLLVVGMANSALPFCLFAYSTLYLDAGFDAILNATMPLWTALIAFVWLGIPMTRSQLIGMLVGVVGVLTLVSGQVGGGAGSWLAIVAVLVATFLYGFSANYSRQYLAGVPAFVVTFGSQFFAVLVLLPFAWVGWPQGVISSIAWYAVIGLGVICTGIAYVIYFKLLDHVGSSYAASVTFLVPIFGVMWGAIFLQEEVTWTMIVGCMIILFGTALASGKWKLFRYSS